MPGMHDIAEFLGPLEPFSELDEAALEDLARRVEVEFFAADTTIVAQGGEPQDRIRVVRRGAVRRAKLYYLRGRTGKSARIAERRDTRHLDAAKAAAETESAEG